MGLTVGDFEQMAGVPEVQENSDTERNRGECNLSPALPSPFVSQEATIWFSGDPLPPSRSSPDWSCEDPEA